MPCCSLISLGERRCRCQRCLVRALVPPIARVLSLLRADLARGPGRRPSSPSRDWRPTTGVLALRLAIGLRVVLAGFRGMAEARAAQVMAGTENDPVTVMDTQWPRQAGTSSPPDRHFRTKLLVRAEDRGFEPRRVLPSNRRSSSMPDLSRHDRDCAKSQARRSGKAGITPGLAGSREPAARTDMQWTRRDAQARSSRASSRGRGGADDLVDRHPGDPGQPVRIRLVRSRPECGPHHIITPARRGARLSR